MRDIPDEIVAGFCRGIERQAASVPIAMPSHAIAVDNEATRKAFAMRAV
jgi:hypothetical protein